MEAIQLIQITPEQLQNKILKGVQSQIDDLKLHFTPKQPNEYLTRQQVATMLGVDLSTLYNWNKKKILSPVGIAGRVYYIRSEVEASLKPL
ncbi:helix-turn-helix domain-containing protein [Flavobacterium psychrophilum]|nr:helix-turn-helix domain-containing protein [Flavobacterium psychrophilum]ELY2009094.1 helix-turn-helix domain-containing protein [Flavobacterium psychrophilum]